MGKGTIGVVTAVVVWVGGAMSADAQNIITGGGAIPNVVPGGTTMFTPRADLYTAPWDVTARFVITRAGSTVFNSGWLAISGTTVSYNVCNFYRNLNETLTFKWTICATGWTTLTLTWTCQVTNYYGHGTLEKSPSPHSTNGEALVWLRREDVEVMA